VEELTWAAVAHGDHAGALPIPDTIEAVLAARLDQLPQEEKHLVQTAAVIGTEVSVPLLQRIAGLPEEALRQGLGHLQSLEFLYETHLFPEHAYTFKHALTREVAYSSLLHERRWMLHAQIVGSMETLYAERLHEHVELLAHHALQGEVWDKAVTYCRQAGTKALAGSAYREAVGYWGQALEALAHLPPDRPMLEQSIDVHCDLSAALEPLDQSAQKLAHLRAAESLTEGLADHRRLGIVYRMLANALRQMQDYELALAYSQRAYASATTLGDVRLQLESHLAMGWIYHNLGDYHPAMEHLQQALTILQGESPSPSFALRHLLGNRPIITLAWIVLCLSELGAFADAIAYGAEALQRAAAVDRPYEYLSVYCRVGYLHVRQGTLHQAIPLLERGVALGQEVDSPIHYREAATYLALAYALADRAMDALAMLRQVKRPGVVCGEAYLLAGEGEEAYRLAQRELEDARHHKIRGNEARALWLLGEIAMHRALPDGTPAAAHYQQALALAEELGMRPLQAHCHRGLGTLYAETRQQELARSALSTALALYRTMDMTFWLPQTEATLAQVG
jgi:tetratricopeptide (TPR) repeat protein